VCPNCHNQVLLHHVRSKKSVRLYFVPVVPYGTDEYLVCPVCSRGLQISKPQLPYVRSMSHATQSFRTGRLTQAQYMAQVERFWRQLGMNPAGQQVFSPASPGAAAPARPAAPAQPTAQPRPAASAQRAAPRRPTARPGAPGRRATPGQPPPAAADSEAPWIAQLRKLAELHDQGVLSDADYEAAKRRVLEEK
jgi:uncharacterized protein YbaR (Trm112 family)